MSNSIITISGRICSGKSFVARLIEAEFGFPIASFGGYLKYFCENNGLPIDRLTLQNKGEEFVKINSQQFLIDVINHYNGNSDVIILEGVRHQSIFEAIQQSTNNHILIFIFADLPTRYNRYYFRNKASDEAKSLDQFLISDNHKVEREIDFIKPHCQLVIDSTTEYLDKLYTFIYANLGPKDFNKL